ncbi:hypothetical protein [Rubidibacter lacunae]|uniref:hypothetical protein n=1 Tax=Rubidibacter lacunae TaxID=582514 RepID=UPI0012EB2C7D|nr:hypothetical protein [Rubidibacter lacunae]
MKARALQGEYVAPEKERLTQTARLLNQQRDALQTEVEHLKQSLSEEKQRTEKVRIAAGNALTDMDLEIEKLRQDAQREVKIVSSSRDAAKRNLSALRKAAARLDLNEQWDQIVAEAGVSIPTH